MDWQRYIRYVCLTVTILSHYAIAYGPPYETQKSPIVMVSPLGVDTKLPCPIDGDPKPYFEWTKDNQYVDAGWDRFEISKGLKIRMVEKEDAGVYTCIGTNGFGEHRVAITLKVTGGNGTSDEDDDDVYSNKPGMHPVFLHPERLRKEPFMRPEGDTIRLRCKAKGKPRPTVFWFKKQGATWVKTSAGKQSQWTLELPSVRKHDSGDYMCKVVNRAGSVNHTFVVEVIERSMMLPEIIPPHPMNTTVETGGTASFQCKVRSEVQPHIQWLKKVDSRHTSHPPNRTISVSGEKYVVLKSDETFPRNDGTYLNKLILRRVDMSQAGMYVCLGANNMGYNYKAAFLVVVPGPNADLINSHNLERTDDSNQDVWDVFQYLLMIGVPVVVIIVLIIIFVVVHRQCNKKPATKLPPARYAPPPMQDKEYGGIQNHQYAAMQSRDRLMKGYPDGRSDISAMQRMYPPPPPPSAHTIYGDC